MYTAQVPKVTYILCIAMGALFVVIGAVEYYFTHEPISSSALPLVGIGVAIGFSIALVRRNGDERVQRNGVSASATVNAVHTTSVKTNGVPKWRIDLRVDAPTPFDASVDVLTFTPPATGDVLGVRYDAAKPSHVVLEDAPPSRARPVSAATPAAVAPGGISFSPEMQSMIDAAFASMDGTASGAVGGARANVTVTTDGTPWSGGGAPPNGPVERAKTLADLDRMRAAGQLTQAEFDSLKRGILGES